MSLPFSAEAGEGGGDRWIRGEEERKERGKDMEKQHNSVTYTR